MNRLQRRRHLLSTTSHTAIQIHWASRAWTERNRSDSPRPAVTATPSSVDRPARTGATMTDRIQDGAGP
jgi:hypothetical protein